MSNSPRIQVNPTVLQWALDSVEESRRQLTEQKTSVLAWIKGDKKPTARQLAEFANKVAVPFGYLLLSSPPNIQFEHAYYRKGVRAAADQLSTNAKAIVRETDKKSAWAEEYLQENGAEELQFIGTARVDEPAQNVAQRIHTVIKYTSNWTRATGSWSEAKRALVEAIESAGIYVVASGIVGNNTHRSIDPEELNGFAIVRPRAPFIFINSKDFVARQIFTLAHELAHIWVGTTAIDAVSFEPSETQDQLEQFCDSVASYFLVPDKNLKALYTSGQNLFQLAEKFRVSSFAINRALYDRYYINRLEYLSNLSDLRQKITPAPSGGGGDYFNNIPVRSSKNFLKLLKEAHIAKNIDYRGASRLLDVKGKSLVKILAS